MREEVWKELLPSRLTSGLLEYVGIGGGSMGVWAFSLTLPNAQTLTRSGVLFRTFAQLSKSCAVRAHSLPHSPFPPFSLSPTPERSDAVTPKRLPHFVTVTVPREMKAFGYSLLTNFSASSATSRSPKAPIRTR